MKPPPLCRRCQVEGVWRYDDDGNVIGKCECRLAAQVQAQAQKLTADAHTEAFKAAKAIIHDAAEQYPEFSANQIRDLFEDARVDSPVIGAAFSACVRDGVIEGTGRYVQSTEASTRHRIQIWASLAFGKRQAS